VRIPLSSKLSTRLYGVKLPKRLLPRAQCARVLVENLESRSRVQRDTAMTEMSVGRSDINQDTEETKESYKASTQARESNIEDLDAKCNDWTRANSGSSAKRGHRMGADTLSAVHASDGEDYLAQGVSVEVRDHFLGSWSRGFEIAGVEDGNYRIRRVSDGTILPVLFPPEDVRRTRHKRGLWWY
jgi:hypothetical protein